MKREPVALRLVVPEEPEIVDPLRPARGIAGGAALGFVLIVAAGALLWWL